MATKTGIANAALSHLGISKVLSDVDTDTGIEARAFNVHYGKAVKEMLEAFPWSFAREYITIEAALAGDGSTVLNGDFLYAYTYPTLCAKVRRIVRWEAGRRDPCPPPFIIGRYYDEDADPAPAYVKALFCDIEASETYPLRLEITRAMTEEDDDGGITESGFDELFSAALAHLMAAKTGPALAKDVKLVGAQLQLYEYQKSLARTAALNEGQSPKEPDSDYIRSRW